MIKADAIWEAAKRGDSVELRKLLVDAIAEDLQYLKTVIFSLQTKK